MKKNNIESLLNLDNKKTILIVDDLSINIEAIAHTLGDEYNISASQDSVIALKGMSFEKPNLILLDLYMPEINGFDFCKIIKSSEKFNNIPIIFITSASNSATLSKAFSLGAVDYIKKPISPLEVQARINTHLKLKDAEEILKYQNYILEIEVERRTKTIKEKQSEVEEVQKETILRLCFAAELRDKETGLHIRRIQEYSALLGRKCGLPEEHVNLLHLASAMHDLGKIGIPDKILLKTGKLTASEWEVMKTHTVIGARSLSSSRFKLIQLAETIAHYHHERWDGKGYPSCLKGEDIPIEARIVSIVDSFDAMLSKRPYKNPMPFEDVLQIIHSNKGHAYDPDIVDTFIGSIEEFHKVCKTFSD